MKHFCRLILLICFFFISICANAFSDETVINLNKHVDTISAINFNDYDVLHNRNNNSILVNVNHKSSLSVLNKNNHVVSDNGYGKYFVNNTCQFDYLLSYIYTQSYLRSQPQINRKHSLSEINPNAP